MSNLVDLQLSDLFLHNEFFTEMKHGASSMKVNSTTVGTFEISIVAGRRQFFKKVYRSTGQ